MTIGSEPVEELRTKFRVYDLVEKKYLSSSITFYLNNNGTLYVFDNTNTLRALPLDRFVVENFYLNHGNGVGIMDILFLAGKLLGTIAGDRRAALEDKVGKEIVDQLVDALQKISNEMNK
jgi:hypothetical protein